MKKTYLVLVLVIFLMGDAWARDEQKIIVEELARTSESWDKETLPEYPEGVPEITVLRITVPPGASLPLHFHPVIKAGVLLEGELTVISENNEVLTLKTGEAIIEVVDKWHYGRNNSETPAVIIVFYAGTKGGPITVTE